jgi:hypothetical protein
MTPAQKWATSAAPLEIVEPERLRWMLMADQTRVVEKDGIHFERSSSPPPPRACAGRGAHAIDCRDPRKHDPARAPVH